MPGATSIEKKEYYGHPDNIFWDIIVSVFAPVDGSGTIENLVYTDRVALLLENNTALWDVLQYCDRKGNLDSTISNEIKNDFESFFSQHPGIKSIFFNGQLARKYFDACFSHLTEAYGLTLKNLPSTSPSHTMNAFKKLNQWREALCENQVSLGRTES